MGKALKSQKGYGLIEVAVALLIFVVAIVLLLKLVG